MGSKQERKACANEKEREIAIVSHLITLSAVVWEEDTAQVAKLLLKCPIPHTDRDKKRRNETVPVLRVITKALK